MSKKSILNKHSHPNPRMLKLKIRIRIRIRGCEKTDIWHIPSLNYKSAFSLSLQEINTSSCVFLLWFQRGLGLFRKLFYGLYLPNGIRPLDYSASDLSVHTKLIFSKHLKYISHSFRLVK